MAAQTCINTQHATLTGTTADSVTFSGQGGSLCVTNHDATNLLYFRADGVTAVGAADETYVCRPGQSKILDGHFNEKTVVSVVGNANIYSVEIY